MTAQLRIALYVDLDNAQLSANDLHLDRCASSSIWMGPLIREIERVTQGTVEIRRCYGNAQLYSERALQDRVFNMRELRERISADAAVQRDLLNNGFQMIHTPAVAGKNRADILMALDSIEEAAKSPHIDIFGVLSDDSDFSPLIHKLRALGKKVAWITVGNGRRARSARSLESMANYRITYDQATLDRVGRDPLLQALRTFEEENPESLVRGVMLTALHARIRQAQPQFGFEDVGFGKLSEMVEASIEPPFVLERNLVFKRFAAGSPAVPAPAPAPAASTASTASTPPAAATLSGAVPRGEVGSRIRSFLGCLSRQGIRPLPQLRRKVTQWLYKSVFDGDGNPLRRQTYGELIEAAENEFCGTQLASKSQVRDALKLLSQAAVLRLQSEERLPLLQTIVAGFEPHPGIRQKLVVWIISRLLSAGVAVTPEDVPDLASILFDDSDADHLESVRKAVVELQTAPPDE